jgi:hypothetical protein
MEKLSGPDVMKAMMSRCVSIEEALDATAKILEERHVKETVDMIEKGKLKLSELKDHVEALTPVNPGEFVWKVLTNCSDRTLHSQNSPGCTSCLRWRATRRDEC